MSKTEPPRTTPKDDGDPAGWRIAESCREGLRNLAVGRWPQFIGAALLLSALGTTTFGIVHTSLEREAANVAGGAYTWIAAGAPDEEPGLSSIGCLALAANGSVAAAGFVAGERQPELWTAFKDGPEIPSRLVSPGILTVFGGSGRLDGPTAGAELSRLGLVADGQRLNRAGTALTIVVEQVLAEQLSYSTLNSMLLVPTAGDQPVDACLVRMVRTDYQLAPTLLAAAFPGVELQVVPFRDTSLDLTPTAQFAGYLSLLPGVLGGAVVAMLLIGLALAGRAQLMVYRLFGTGRSELTFILMVEHAVGLLAAAVVAIPVGWLIGGLAFGVTNAAAAGQVAAFHVLSAFGAATALLALAFPLIVAGDPLRALRDR